jgi:hypothetical protein
MIDTPKTVKDSRNSTVSHLMSDIALFSDDQSLSPPWELLRQAKTFRPVNHSAQPKRATDLSPKCTHFAIPN